jgi:GNAT acetyltransferase-like protein
MRDITVETEPGDAWDAFVDAHPRATAYHLSAWARILRSAYRFRPVYLAARESDGSITGVLPLVERGGRISGSRLNSLPVARWAGPLAASPDDEASLIDAACGLVREGRAERLQIRTMTGGYEAAVEGLIAHTNDPPSWRIPLPADEEAFLARLKTHSKSRIRDIRKAERSGVTVREGHSQGDLRRFYRLYLQTMKKHRLLPRSFRQLSLGMRLLGPRVFRLLLVEYEGTPVAGGVFHLFGDVADLLFNGSDDTQYDLRPNHALYWAAIKLCMEEGHPSLDLGLGSIGTPLGEFKRRWGAESVPRHRYTYPPATNAASTGSGVTQPSTSLAERLARDDEWFVARAWERAPLALTRLAGTIGYRYL